jgi:hypothetical protein
MKFVREISLEGITEKTINDLTNYGFTLIWKESSVEVWADCTEQVA